MTTFEEAVAQIKLAQDVSIDVKLRLYGLYKQVTSGNNNTPCPTYFNIKERSKWYAWDAVRDRDIEICKKEYIELVLLVLK